MAGVTIGALTGENSLINQAGEAKEEAEIASEKEVVEKATIEAMGQNKYGNLEKDELQTALDSQAGEGETKATETGDIIRVLFTNSNRNYAVDKNGNVRDMIWWEEIDENGNNLITNGEIILQTGDYITYNANDNGEHIYIAEPEKTGVTTSRTFSSSYEIRWRLLGIEHSSEGDYLMIIPAYPTISSNTETGLSLRGAVGYQYGIEVLEEISKIYGYGNGALYSRAIKIEDINKITGYDPMNTGDGTIFREGTIYEYGVSVNVTRTGYYSNTLVYSNGLEGNWTYNGFKYFNFNKEWTELNIGETVTITNSYYTYYPTTLTDSAEGEVKGISTDSREYDMLFPWNTTYWIASRYELGGGSNEYISDAWGLFYVSKDSDVSIGYCGDNYLIYVGGNQFTLTRRIMPIVCLKKDIQLEATGNQVNTCAEWKIKK